MAKVSEITKALARLYTHKGCMTCAKIENGCDLPKRLNGMECKHWVQCDEAKKRGDDLTAKVVLGELGGE